MAGRKTFRFPEAWLPAETRISRIGTDFQAQSVGIREPAAGASMRLDTVTCNLRSDPFRNSSCADHGANLRFMSCPWHIASDE